MEYQTKLVSAALGTLILTLFSCGSSPKEERFVEPELVAVRVAEASEEGRPNLVLTSPVAVVINDRKQKLYDLAQHHYRTFYAEERSMCLAAPFLWQVNPQLRDIYQVEPGERVFVPSGEDYRRWRSAMNVWRPQQVAFIANPDE